MSRREVHDRFDVVCLGEHIKCAERVKSIGGVEEWAEVACKGGGVAGDVTDAARAQGEDGFEGFGFRAGAGRVEEEEVNGGESRGVGGEPVADARGVDGGVGETCIGEVEAREVCGRSVAFDGVDLCEAAREGEREEADAAVEVERGFARGVFESFGEERFEQGVVDLKEAIGVEAIAFARERARALVGVRFRERRQERDAVVARHGLKFLRVIKVVMIKVARVFPRVDKLARVRRRVQAARARRLVRVACEQRVAEM